MSDQSQDFFPEEVIERLKYYVYRLIDPRDGETFFVGQGAGNKVFNHAIGIAEYNSEAEKINRINCILECGLQVAHVIHRHGLSKEVASEVAEALIAAYPATSSYRKSFGVCHSIELINSYSDSKQLHNNEELYGNNINSESLSYSEERNELIIDIAKLLEASYDEGELIKKFATESGFIELGTQTYASVPIHITAPTSGKDSSLVLSIVKNIAVKQRRNITVFTSGITKKEIAFRVVCTEANLPYEKVQSGIFNERNFPILIDAASKIADAPIDIVELPLLSVEAIRAKCQSLHRKSPLYLLVVYNASLISTGYNGESSKRKFEEFLKDLNALGIELNLPIIFTSETKIKI